MSRFDTVLRHDSTFFFVRHNVRTSVHTTSAGHVCTRARHWQVYTWWIKESVYFELCRIEELCTLADIPSLHEECWGWGYF